MIEKNFTYKCKCSKCSHVWNTRKDALPDRCAACNVTGWNSDYIEPIVKLELSLVDRVRDLPVADRKTLFDAFELCCAMNRGACICPPEEIEIAPPSPVHHVVETPAGMNSAMARFLESQAVQIAEAEPIDEWAGWSEERQAPDEQAGEIVTYRQHIKKGTRKEIRRESAW